MNVLVADGLIVVPTMVIIFARVVVDGDRLKDISPLAADGKRLSAIARAGEVVKNALQDVRLAEGEHLVQGRRGTRHGPNALAAPATPAICAPSTYGRI
ncbi:MAG: hypothetical protein ABIR73_13210 [Usitatibacter sp.]